MRRWYILLIHCLLLAEAHSISTLSSDRISHALQSRHRSSGIAVLSRRSGRGRSSESNKAPSRHAGSSDARPNAFAETGQVGPPGSGSTFIKTPGREIYLPGDGDFRNVHHPNKASAGGPSNQDGKIIAVAKGRRVSARIEKAPESTADVVMGINLKPFASQTFPKTDNPMKEKLKFPPDYGGEQSQIFVKLQGEGKAEARANNKD